MYPNQADSKILQDLYKILVKVTAENKSLRLSLSEYQDIIEDEVRNQRKTQGFMKVDVYSLFI